MFRSEPSPSDKYATHLAFPPSHFEHISVNHNSNSNPHTVSDLSSRSSVDARIELHCSGIQKEIQNAIF